MHLPEQGIKNASTHHGPDTDNPKASKNVYVLDLIAYTHPPRKTMVFSKRISVNIRRGIEYLRCCWAKRMG
jgi:hypothetical protein